MLNLKLILNVFKVKLLYVIASDIAEEIRSRVTDTTAINMELQGDVKFAIWVSFMEIYNEQIFDLLDLTPIGKGKRRTVLKMGDDKDKNPYVKGINARVLFCVFYDIFTMYFYLKGAFLQIERQ